MSNVERTEAERKLDCFVGDWQNTGHVNPGRFGPGGPVTGSSSYRWEVRGKWLTYVSRLHLPGMGEYEVRGGVAYDARANKYAAFAYNNLGVLLTYDGQWESDTVLVFTSTYPQKGVARVSYHLQAAGGFRFRSDSVKADGTIETYFETQFTRV